MVCVMASGFFYRFFIASETCDCVENLSSESMAMQVSCFDVKNYTTNPWLYTNAFCSSN